MTHPVIEYLKNHGELPATKILVPDMTLGAIKNALRRFYLEGVLLRREIVVDGCKEKLCMAYGLSGKTARPRKKPQTNEERIRTNALKNEPDYAFHLRNLPRNRAMKVKDLIALLSTMPQEVYVAGTDDEFGTFEFSNVYFNDVLDYGTVLIQMRGPETLEQEYENACAKDD
jgi:hypothetical protein